MSQTDQFKTVEELVKAFEQIVLRHVCWKN
jgi:hypothetical protein